MNSLISIACFVHLVYLQTQKCCLDFRHTFSISLWRGAEASCLGRICRLCEARRERGEMKRKMESWRVEAAEESQYLCFHWYLQSSIDTSRVKELGQTVHSKGCNPAVWTPVESMLQVRTSPTERGPEIDCCLHVSTPDQAYAPMECCAWLQKKKRPLKFGIRDAAAHCWASDFCCLWNPHVHPKASAKPKKLCILTICTRSFIRILTASSVPSVSMDALCRSCQDLPEQEAGLVGCCIPVALGVDDNPSTVAYILNNNNSKQQQQQQHHHHHHHHHDHRHHHHRHHHHHLHHLHHHLHHHHHYHHHHHHPVALGLLSLTMFNIFSHVSVAPPSIWTFYAHMTSVGTRRNGWNAVAPWTRRSDSLRFVRRSSRGCDIQPQGLTWPCAFPEVNTHKAVIT